MKLSRRAQGEIRNLVATHGVAGTAALLGVHANTVRTVRDGRSEYVKDKTFRSIASVLREQRVNGQARHQAEPAPEPAGIERALALLDVTLAHLTPQARRIVLQTALERAAAPTGLSLKGGA